MPSETEIKQAIVALLTKEPWGTVASISTMLNYSRGVVESAMAQLKAAGTVSMTNRRARRIWRLERVNPAPWPEDVA